MLVLLASDSAEIGVEVSFFKDSSSFFLLADRMVVGNVLEINEKNQALY